MKSAIQDYKNLLSALVPSSDAFIAGERGVTTNHLCNYTVGRRKQKLSGPAKVKVTFVDVSGGI